MEAKHTATPWHTTSSSMGVHTYVEARIGGGVVQEIASCGPTEGPEGSSGNAEFIVRACNSHESLLAACKAVDSEIELTGHVSQSSVEMVRAAIIRVSEA